MLSDRQYALRDGLRSEDHSGTPNRDLRSAIFGPRRYWQSTGGQFESESLGYSEFIKLTPANDPTAGLPRLGAREELFQRLLDFWALDNSAGATLLGYQVDGQRHVTDILNGVEY